MKPEYWDIDKLESWRDNPRTITRDDFARLKVQVQKLGMYKPLLINKQGIVLGGNMRLAVYKDLGIKKVWVSIVDAEDPQKMLEYALSDNDRVGNYDEMKLSELLTQTPLELDVYKVDLAEPKGLDQLPTMFDPTNQDDQGKLDQKKEVECPSCGHIFTT